MTEISARSLARLVRVAERTAREYAAKGIFVRAGRGFDLDASVGNYCAHLRRARTGKRGEGVALGSDERRRLARLQADALEIKIARERGALIAESIVESEWSGVVIAIRNELLAVSAQFAAAAPHVERRDVATVDSLIREALTRLGERAST